jgi:hypothetical protein
MPIGYEYQSSGDAGYVNWAEVAKGFTDMLSKENADREARKAAFDERDRKIANDIANAPMGQFKDANDFTSNAVDSITKQKQIASRLFKAGRISEKQYTLMQNNIEDGTKTLFDLTKAYQDKYAAKMAGISTGKLQAINTNMMSTIEGFADFSKSKAMVDPASGIINLAKMKFNDKTGIWETTNDIMPVGSAMRNIGTDIETFDVDAATTKTIAGMGTLKDALYQAATKNSAGTITEFLGPEAFKKYPDASGVIDNFNKAIDNSIEGYLAGSPYNLTSVLTQNTGKYDATSFTYDKDEAAKDPSKILLKMDPGTKMPVMDETSPNYDKQKKEATELIRTQMLSKIDRERKIQATSQLTDQTYHKPEWEYAADKDVKKTTQTGEMLAALYAGNDQQASAARTFFKGLDNVEDVERNATGVTIYYKDKSKKKLDFTAGGSGIGVENFVDAGTKALLGNDVDLTDARKGIKKYKGKPLNEKYIVEKPAVTKDFTPQVQNIVTQNKGIIKDDDTSDNITRLAKAYSGLGFKFEQPKDTKGKVTITSPDGEKQTISLFKAGLMSSTSGGLNPDAEDAINNFIVSKQNNEYSRKALAPTEDVNAAASEGGNKAPR